MIYLKGWSLFVYEAFDCCDLDKLNLAWLCSYVLPMQGCAMNVKMMAQFYHP